MFLDFKPLKMRLKNMMARTQNRLLRNCFLKLPAIPVLKPINHILEIALSIPAVSGWNGRAMIFAGWTAIGSVRVKRQGYW